MIPFSCVYDEDFDNQQFERILKNAYSNKFSTYLETVWVVGMQH